jgi:spermidine synthase
MAAVDVRAPREWARAGAVGVAAFVSGGVLLSVEIAASRVLAPFFGNSLYVWGAVIGVVLAGLALGYAAGGGLADRAPTPLLLLGVLLLGSVGVLLVPVLDELVLEFVVRWDPGVRLDPVIAMILLFGLPSVVLAAVTPIAVRLRARELAVLGRTAGRLFSVSTCGSIAGTFVTAFWLIPELGTDQLLALMAAALFVVAGIVALAERLWLPFGVAAAACVGAVVASFALAPDSGGTLSRVAAQNWSPVFRVRERPTGPPIQFGGKIVFQKDTQYHRLAVVDVAGERELRFDSSYQSAMSLEDPYATVIGYTDYMQLGLAYQPAARNVLMIGLGGGTVPKRMWRDFPALSIQVVELDPVVAQVARRYFHLPADGPRLRTTIEDGRRYLANTERRWDVIMIDAFYADAIPFHMATLEFLELARSRLAPDGVIVTNVIGAISGEDSELFRSIFRTYRAAFPAVVVHPVDGSPGDDGVGVRNLIVVASNNRVPAKETLVQRSLRRRTRFPSAPDLTQAIRGRWEGEVSSAGVPVLTDDYAPTDALLAD